MPPLKDVTTMVTAARSRLIRFTFIIQNYAQLTQVYGKENAETIKGNCNITYLISSELGALEELSKLCGEVKSKDKDKTASTPLVTVSDLQRLQQYETISLRLRTMPFKTKLVPNWKMDWGRTYDKATYPDRPRQTVELFDIREFVKEQKRKKAEEMMGGQGGTFPSGGMMNRGTSPMGMGNPMFGGVNPFAMNNPFDMNNSALNSPSPSPSPSDSSFNVDELVKRIDAKIAELEEEERQEKEKEKAKTIDVPAEPTPTPVTAPTPAPVVDTPTPAPVKEETQVVPAEKETPSININDLSKETATTPVATKEDDDAFFDDFFSDEE